MNRVETIHCRECPGTYQGSCDCEEGEVCLCDGPECGHRPVGLPFNADTKHAGWKKET